MFKVENNIIKLTRGDDANLAVIIEQGKLEEGDTATLSVKKKIKDDVYALQCIGDVDVERNRITFKINHDMTKDIAFGKYYFDIQVKSAADEISTIVTPDTIEVDGETLENFYVLKEVTIDG